jgi:hypothetical protein
MDILAFKYLYEGLVEFNAQAKPNYGNEVLDEPPFFGTNEKIVYPITIIQEIRNVATNYDFMHERVASVGYRVDILAQDKKKAHKQDIAREIAVMVNTYMSKVGLKRVSYNYEILYEGTTAHIIMTFSGSLNEYRRKFI